MITKKNRFPHDAESGFVGFVRVDLRLADGVNVTGEVEHLVGEAPFVVVRY